MLGRIGPGLIGRGLAKKERPPEGPIPKMPLSKVARVGLGILLVMCAGAASEYINGLSEFDGVGDDVS